MIEHAAIDLIVPVYRNASATKRCIESILEHVAEIREFEPRLIVINDSPDDRAVDDLLGKLAVANPDTIILKNSENCGFVKSVNRALEVSRRDGRDVILINSDTESFEGTLANLIAAGYSDPQIGFASPRSNNASFASLPHSSMFDSELSPDESHRRWREVGATLPPSHFTPTAIGFYLFIKHEVLAKCGGLGEEFGMGYHEENDLIMRASRHGYRAILANRSFAFHAGSASFKLLDIDLNSHITANTDKLLAIHPEFMPLIAGYLSSVHFRAEGLLSGLLGHSLRAIKLVVDLSDLDCGHDEADEFALRIVRTLAERHGAVFDLSVLCSAEQFVTRRLDELGNIGHLALDDPGQHAVAVRIGLPDTLSELKVLESLAPIIIIGVHDSISEDVDGPSSGLPLSDHREHAARHANGFIFTSDICERKFCCNFTDAQALPAYKTSSDTKLSNRTTAFNGDLEAGWAEWIDGLAEFFRSSLTREDIFFRLCDRLLAAESIDDADRKAAAIGAAANLPNLLRLDGRRFVECAYMTVLKRPPDRAGLKHHLALLRKGVPKIQIIVGMRASPEGKKLDCELEGLPEATANCRSSRLKTIRSLVEFWR
jgi:GT2 family glycosyltransferase